MLVILSDVLELFFAHVAIERSEGFANFGLDIRFAGDVVLTCHESEKLLAQHRLDTSLSARWSSLSFKKRSEASSRRWETVVSIIRAS